MHGGQPEKPATKARDGEKRTTTAPPLYVVYRGIPFCINMPMVMMPQLEGRE